MDRTDGRARWSRSALLVLAAFGLVGAFVAAWFPAREHASALAALQHKADNQARLIAYTIAPAIEFEDRVLIAEAFRGAARDVDFVGIEAFDARGQSLASAGDPAPTSGPQARVEIETPIELSDGAAGRLRLVMSTARIDAVSREQLAVGVAIGATILLLGLFVSLWIGRTIRRITALMLENDRQRAAAQQANEVKSRFLANMSHEIRTPLNGVLGLADVLSRRTLDERSSSLVASIARSARSLLALVNDILDLSRIEAGRLELELEPFDPEAAAVAVCEMFMPACRQRAIELVLDVRASVPASVKGDRLRFEQVLTNLVGNAVKFTAKGRVVVELSWDAHASTLSVAVRDTGIGIPSEKLDSIFESFSQADTSTTRRFGGSGLGLAISRSLVQRAGGEMRVESEPGRGSVFSFHIPSEALAEPPPSTLRAPPSRILLVAVDPAVRAVVRAHAERCGVTLDDVERGDVIDALSNLPTGGDPAVLIWDARAHEPVREVADAIARAVEAGRIRCVGHAAMVDEPPLRRTTSSVLPKPFSRSAFVRAVEGTATTRDATSPLRRGGLPATLRVLIAEDDETNRLVVRSFLEELGVRADVVHDGRAAVERATGETPYDIILMDCQMPELDGYEATMQIRHWERATGRAPTPIVAVTAHAIAEERARALSVGMNGHVTKPLTLEVFRAALQEHANVAGEAMEAAPRSELEPESEVLIVERMRHDRARAQEIVLSFQRGADTGLAAIGDALNEERWDVLARHAHTIKGSCLSVGARRAAALATELESRARQHDTAATGEHALRLEMELADVVDRMRELVPDRVESEPATS